MNLGAWLKEEPRDPGAPVTWGELRQLLQALAAGVPGEYSLPAPVSVDEKTARQMLGGLSSSTLQRELLQGNLDRVPGTRRLLITRQSLIEWPTRKREQLERRARLKVQTRQARLG